MTSIPRRATLSDVAAAAEVSIKTASRVINGVETVAPALRDRVREAVETLGYRPHRGAAAIRSGTSDMIGMVIRDMANSFYSMLAAGVGDITGQRGCLLITCSSEGDPVQEKKLAEAVFSHRPRGVLITPTLEPQPLIAAEVRLGTPVVAIDEPISGLKVDTVSFANYDATIEAVNVAIELGRTRFAILSDTDRLGTMPKRVEGAKHALSLRGLHVEPEMELRTAHTVEQATQLIGSILSLPKPPDAVFCANNVSALAAASVIHATGLDVAVVAFDRFPMSHALSQPVIVVEHDDREMGREAARLLFRRIDNPYADIRSVTIGTTIRRY